MQVRTVGQTASTACLLNHVGTAATVAATSRYTFQLSLAFYLQAAATRKATAE